MTAVEHSPEAAETAPAEPARQGRAAIARLSLAIVAISFTPVLFRQSELGPTATSFYRTLLAIPVFVIWYWIERRRERGVRKVAWLRDGPALMLGGAVYAANILAYAWAVHFTTVANASLLSNTTPIFVALGSFLVFRDRVRLAFMLSMLAAIAGMIVLAWDKLGIDADRILGAHQILGDGLGILSAVTFAAYLVVIGRLSPRLGSATIMLWTGIVTAIGLLLGALAAGESLAAASLMGWAALLGLGIVSYALGQGLLTLALAHVGAAFSAVALLSLPVSAAFYGWLLLGEPVTLNQGIGGAIILASILGARLSRG
ncbi:MAG: DMT family transporter [Proteobacteria bacterium]|nr:DMT family transporter [Pseudomonadota bacterium]MBI3498433.1 DMT family transporter [Pseudomonadota bacterium]